MYTQWLENPHNALCESRAESIAASCQKMAPAAESSIHSFYNARSSTVYKRNTTQVQIHFKLILKLFNQSLYIISMTEFKINPLILLELPVLNDY